MDKTYSLTHTHTLLGTNSNTHRRSTDFSYLRLFGSDDAIGIVVTVRLDLPRLSRRLLFCNSTLHNLNHFFNCPLVVTPSGFGLSRVKPIHCLSLSVTFSPLFESPFEADGMLSVCPSKYRLSLYTLHQRSIV
ncbi:hypothetical protein HER10_EVM0003327 [Colletotrichum scovillei]|uniref:uncharacterized protein n=1 Tax=Colletotrichum scovillei TaxID=1209932 RepID=UPI0015C2F7A9|nr:uncharacterized protein HER10_EVM0003327 [Colletotrichum scovillei]KAF4777535.1 hypothetical protein HER10_EVM0003327 [Colletotrichum scovillei]